MIIERVIVNFATKCNMGCPYCYIPFDGKRSDFDMLTTTLHRCKELGVKVITFGGGDPFLHEYFRDALRLAAELAFEVHVDTNGISLCKDDFSLLSSTTSLLGLPLDGSNCEVHMKLRGSSTHYEKVLKHLKDLVGFKIRVKINTVASRRNLYDLKNMPKLLGQFRIHIWSLYQYMPLAGGKRVEDEFTITDSEFHALVDELNALTLPFHFEPSAGASRNHSYFFVSPSGSAYTHDPSNSKNYLHIGNINDRQCIQRFQEINQESVRSEARHRYHSLQ